MVEEALEEKEEKALAEEEVEDAVKREKQPEQKWKKA